MGRLIAISDIHGCCLTFEKLLININFSPEDHLVLLGDYIDRGPRSKEVLDLILFYLGRGYKITCLKGNHEVMFLEAFEDDTLTLRFLRAGGDMTLQSFGVSTVKEVSLEYIQFMKGLKDVHVEGRFVFVHAGLNFSNTDPFEDKESMFWMRGMVVDPASIDYKTVVYGHTPVLLKEIKEMIDQRNLWYKVDIDNGCVFQREGMNSLLAYFPEENNFVVQKNIDYL